MHEHLSRLSASACAVTPWATRCRVPGRAATLGWPGPPWLGWGRPQPAAAPSLPCCPSPRYTRWRGCCQVNPRRVRARAPVPLLAGRWLHAHAMRLHRCMHTSWRGSSAPFWPRRPRPACGGDPSTDSVFPPLSSVHHGRWGRSLCVGRRDHHRPIHRALSFVVLWPCRSIPPHHERCPTLLQFWSFPSASPLRPSSAVTHGCPQAVPLESNWAHQ
jgi:hypothetical protein